MKERRMEMKMKMMRMMMKVKFRNSSVKKYPRRCLLV